MDKSLLIKKFNKLVAQKNACEIWFDEPSTTDEQRRDMTPKLLKACNEMVDIANKLAKVGYLVMQNDYFNGIKEGLE